jgi:hypothetical protein
MTARSLILLAVALLTATASATVSIRSLVTTDVVVEMQYADYTARETVPAGLLASDVFAAPFLPRPAEAVTFTALDSEGVWRIDEFTPGEIEEAAAGDALFLRLTERGFEPYQPSAFEVFPGGASGLMWWSFFVCLIPTVLVIVYFLVRKPKEPEDVFIEE